VLARVIRVIIRVIIGVIIGGQSLRRPS
jgi:hypothetical protein